MAIHELASSFEDRDFTEAYRLRADLEDGMSADAINALGDEYVAAILRVGLKLETIGLLVHNRVMPFDAVKDLVGGAAIHPVSYSLYALVVLFAVISLGESPISVVQNIFVPYTVDMSRGIGDTGVPVFRAVAMMSQCLMCFFIYTASRHQSKSRRLAFSVIGICFVIFCFLIVAFAYIKPRFD